MTHTDIVTVVPFLLELSTEIAGHGLFQMSARCIKRCNSTGASDVVWTRKGIPEVWRNDLVAADAEGSSQELSVKI